MKCKILLADDDELVLASLKSALEFRGYEVTVAPNGDEALNRHKKSAHSILLLDLKMPGISGRELITLMQKENSLAKIIIMSGAGKAKDFDFLKEFPDVHFIAKPFSAPKLFSVIDAIKEH